MQPIKIALIILTTILFSKTEKLWDLGVAIDSSQPPSSPQAIYGYKLPKLKQQKKQKKKYIISFEETSYTDHQIQQLFINEDYDLLVNHLSNKKKERTLSEKEIFYYLNTLIKIKKISADNPLINGLSNDSPSHLYLKILIFELLEDQNKKIKYSNLLFERHPQSEYALILKQSHHLIHFKM
ncbi:MAG: hypothetical protein CBD58_02615 [bacterium TMED198]|nr:MAG: hypothetical protein CBD58_02615 [bacterium TMED198]|tara:strand:+ start:1054 stop:1599 length:546 start_codon:yes stop_codon:yes gene_type:complete